MAVTTHHLTTSSNTANTTAYTTASISPTANRLVLLSFLVSITGTTPAATVTGCGLTWEQVDQTAAAARTTHLFRAMGTPSTGAVTITFGGTVTACLWSIVEFGGVDTSGTNGSGAIVQSINDKPPNGTSLSVPFNSAITSGNGAFSAVGLAVQELPVAGSGWTAAGSTSNSAPTNGFLSQYAVSGPPDIEASWTTSANTFVVGAEIKAAGATNLNNLKLGSNNVGLRLGASTPSKAYKGSTQVWP